ncbi:MAG: hypothetical protein HYZ44_10745 [Bacteroidetes bacterium]|nr:hypothetical protein [Bacteroidota bacterium]
MKLRYLLIVSLCLFSLQQAVAWVYPEHRRIAILAIQKLSEPQRIVLERLWAEARLGHENRLTSDLFDLHPPLRPQQLDYASWMGIAGDHSCSPEAMLNTVLYSDWILRVAEITFRLEADLAKSKNASQLVNALRDSDIKLQHADIDYATRAGSNNVHFLLSRRTSSERAEEFLANSLRDSVDLNAIAAYAWFHTLALRKAALYSANTTPVEQKPSLALAALADEAFAIHFLQDMFSAGHIAGTWGNASLRKGTHDYYNERGLEVITWEGTKRVAKGDAYMREEDADFAAEAVKLSLQQLINAAEGNATKPNADWISVKLRPDTLDICKSALLPNGKLDFDLVKEVLMKTPVPGLGSGLGELPRFRSELGLFLGLSTSVNVSSIRGGFAQGQEVPGSVAGLEADVMIGYGLEGVLNQTGDGLVFFQAGWRQDSPSSTQFSNNDPNYQANSITSIIPGRSAYSVRLRFPFWLVPGDLLLAGPILGFTHPKAFQKIGVEAVNGGVIGWQSRFATPIGRFQFILGREVGLSIYGLGGTADALFVPTSPNTLAIVTYKSIKYDFPFLEYQPVRSFSQSQSSALKLQFSFGVDTPFKMSTVTPANQTELDLKPIWYVSARLIFNWRYYF